MVPPLQSFEDQSLAQGSYCLLGVVGCTSQTISVPRKEHDVGKQYVHCQTKMYIDLDLWRAVSVCQHCNVLPKRQPQKLECVPVLSLMDSFKN